MNSAEFLEDKLKEAYATREEMIDSFLGLCVIQGRQRVAAWEKESTEPVFVDGQWQSVYRYNLRKREWQHNPSILMLYANPFDSSRSGDHPPIAAVSR